MHNAQHGFTNGRSTCTNLLVSFQDWTLYLQDKQQVVIAYVDFSKAFDFDSHNKLFIRLQYLTWHMWKSLNVDTRYVTLSLVSQSAQKLVALYLN